MANSNNETTTRFRADMSQFKAEFNDAQRQIRLLNSEFTATASTMDNWRNSAEGVQGKLTQLNGTLTQEQAKLHSLQQQYNRVAQELGANSEEAIRLQTQMNNQQATINKTQREIQRYTDELGVMNRATYVARQTGQEFDAALSDVRRAMRQAEQSGNSFATELRAVQRATELAQSTGQNYNQSLETVRRAMQQATQTGNTYESELDAVQRAQNLARSSGQDYDTSLNQVREALRTASETGRDYYDVLREMNSEQNDTNDTAIELDGGFSILAGTIASLAADAIKAAIGAFGDLMTAGDEALNKLQSQTGASNEVMSEYKDVINDLYKSGIGEDLNDVADAIARIVQTNDDLTSDQLKEYADNALYMRDTFDFDVSESIRAVNMLMDQFGISSDEAFNLMQQGAENGLNKNGDLMDVINEYSVHFAQLGYDSNEFFNILKAGTDAGAFSVDKIGDGYKELGVRVIDYSATTRDAFESLNLVSKNSSEAMEELSGTVADQKSKYEDLQLSLVECYEKQSSFNDETSELEKQKMDKKIRDITGEMETLGGSIAGNEELIASMAEQSTGAGTSFEELTQTIAKGGPEGNAALQQVLDALFAVEDEAERNRIGVELFGTMWEDNGAKVMEAANNASDSIDGMGDSLENAKNVRYDDIGSQIKNVGRTLKTDLIQPLVDELKPYAEQIITYITDNLPAIKEKFQPISDAIVGFVDFIINDLIPTLDTISPIIVGITTAIAGLGVLGLVAEIGTLLPMLITWVTSTKLVTAVQWLLNVALNANPIGLIVVAITAVIAALVLLYNKSEAFRNFINGLWEGLKKIASEMDEFFIGLFTKISEAISKHIEHEKKVLAEMWENIKTSAKAIGAFFTEMLPAFFKWIGEKIAEFAAYIWDKFNNFLTSIIEFFTLIFTTISEWAVNLVNKAAELGSNFVDTIITFFKELPGKIWEFITEVYNNVLTWTSDMINKAKEMATTFVTNIVTFISELPGKIWDKLVEVVNRVKTWGTDLAAKGLEAATNLFDSIINKVRGLPDEMLNVGKNLVEGLWNGINNMGGWISDKISGFSGDVLDSIKDFFGIHSPSRVMKNIVGKNLVLGMVEGIKDETKTAVSEMGILANKVIGAGETNLQGIAAPISAGGMGTNNTSNVYNFYQTNNSPKSLSRLDIYRQSKNLFNYQRGI